MAAKIFSYAGQSNIVGLRSLIEYIPSYGFDREVALVRNGRVDDLSPYLIPDPEGVKGYRDEGYVPAGYATLGYSVEMFLSQIFRSKQDDLVALKTAAGGTSLQVHWSPSWPGQSWKQLRDEMAIARTEARKLDRDVEVGPLIWWHGETDSTVPDFATAYEGNLREFIDGYRDLVGDPSAKIIIVLTVTGGGGWKRREVQAAQRKVADEDPNVLLYDPSHLPRHPDNLHFARDYSIQAAAEMANMMIEAGWAETDNGWGTGADDEIRGDSAGQFLWGLAGDDTIRGMGGDDTLAGDLGSDHLDGGAGVDTAVFDAATTGVTVNLASGRGRGNIASGDTLVRVENVQGSHFSDTLTGDARSNRLEGGRGADTISGGRGQDTILGGRHDDSISGGSGGDLLLGEDGADMLSGGTGKDWLSGGAGDDTLAGGPDADRLSGGTGNDTYRVGKGDRVEEANSPAGGTDTVLSSVSWRLTSGVEVLQLTGKKGVSGTGDAGANTLIGNGAANLLRGLRGNDSLDGGAGNDTLSGGAGADQLTGGAGADVFVFDRLSTSTVGAPDMIRGFGGAGSAGGDRIDLSDLDANTGRAGDQGFSLGANGAGSLDVSDQGGDTLIRGDVDGAAGYDFAILIRDGATRAADYTADDFIL